MRNHNERRTPDDSITENDVRNELANEGGTARRQELLKSLWKLTQQSSSGELNVPSSTVNAGPSKREGPSRSVLEKSCNCSTSC
jgi:hypothetical protein